MLSQEIYDSWNAKTVSDLQELLDSISGPQIPKDVQSTAFKTAVLQKIEQRRVADANRIRDARIERLHEEAKPGCCPCFPRSDDPDRRLNDCKTMGKFQEYCVVSTTCFSKSIATVKALIQKLSYWESIKPGTDGLSVIGGYIWLLSFACQHLIDSPNFKDQYRMQAHLINVKEKYQELGQAGELFIELAETFHHSTYLMRGDALLILKRLTKRWSILEENNPLHIRPELVKTIPRPRKRLGAGLESPIDLEDDDDVFSVKWSPLTVYIQMSCSEAPKAFGRLHPQDRITIFRRFLQCTLDKVEMAAEDLTLVYNQISAIEMDSQKIMEGRDITLAMLAFSKSNNVPRNLSDKEKRRMVIILNEFWYSLDVLHENVYILLRLVQETRDIIRTCYVYTDIFYKWHMPNYDTFIPKNKLKNSKSSMSSAQAEKLLQRFSHGKKLSETTSIMSLMDFSSSIYQGVVQEMPIQCDEMILRLRSNENTDAFDEPMGLVSGIVDKRKSCIVGTDSKKSVPTG